MIDHNASLYKTVPEVWNKKKCAKMANYTAKDGMGTPYPFKGYIGCAFGPIRYNGGCVRDGKWWQGEDRSLPTIDSEYEIVKVPTWGYRIVKKSASKTN